MAEQLEQPADPRQRVVDAADELFYARGIRAVGMDDVRTASGVSLKRLYSLFPGKDSLVLAVLRKRHSMWTEGLSAAVESVEEPRDRLLAVYDYLAEWFAQDSFRGCGFINAFGELGPTSPEVAAYAREHKRSFQAQLVRMVAEAGVDVSLAPQLAILAEGAQTTAAIEGSPDAASHARRAAETLIDAAAAGTPAGRR
ncbi:TetR/AcrR family transcriptional regulator [Nocardioides bizhenqiangii]|uniref:TetR/AcrR family transcriptional regulator n=1 Tax=Nocardioides bizhenqiangii TaxID=3095076 RepID=A0ABZ0ZPK8_9ACTN|nr:TetR/AcrR family transcriptional regulator [Nocardioides sp. HM61]WQQ26148.1 TetR/AcrR family transcriptional regulator [Nocardioides sp. HM61]